MEMLQYLNALGLGEKILFFFFCTVVAYMLHKINFSMLTAEL